MKARSIKVNAISKVIVSTFIPPDVMQTVKMSNGELGSVSFVYAACNKEPFAKCLPNFFN